MTQKPKSKYSCIVFFLFFLQVPTSNAHDKLSQAVAKIETDWQGRIGVFAYEVDGDFSFAYRETERFPFCSSFKAFVSAAILTQSQNKLIDLNTIVNFQNRELEFWSPITEMYRSDGMTIGQLAKAAIQYSDNGATNILLERYIGGPKQMNYFMRSLGDSVFRLDRWELELNTAIPGDNRDTSTPYAMATTLGNLAFSDTLELGHRKIFHNWLMGNTTGDKRIRASVPNTWIVGDKTGTCGSYAAANDIAIIWREQLSPLVIAIYTHKLHATDKHSDQVIASVTSEIVKHISDITHY
ncbi:class A beta-lactamase [Vibrio cholerae]|uniref:class A beta-lactamase n=1 Tax=Vibrio cholerae TaxID=666 RepID=UPI00208CE918|nr:class A beta-lactamase [Vibrio cholerae]MEB5518197.1 class A beta-lactamase [Vibrio cholerae]GIB53444.1 beta-lactamase [Vibrio cholerae]